MLDLEGKVTILTEATRMHALSDRPSIEAMSKSHKDPMMPQAATDKHPVQFGRTKVMRK